MKLPVDYRKLKRNERKEVRDEYVKLQKGKCNFCNTHLEGPPSKEILENKVTEDLYPPGFFNYPVHLHHNHETGMTIGAVHCYCNAVLWEHYGE